MMISYRKRKRLIRNKVNEGITASEQAFVSDTSKYYHVNDRVECHEAVLADIKQVGLIRKALQNFKEIINGDENLHAQKMIAWTQYATAMRDLSEIVADFPLLPTEILERKINYVRDEVKHDIKIMEDYRKEAQGKYKHHFQMIQDGNDEPQVREYMTFWEGKQEVFNIAVTKLQKLLRMLKR